MTTHDRRKSSTQTGSEELDLEALIRDAYEIVEAQMEAGVEYGGGVAADNDVEWRWLQR